MQGIRIYMAGIGIQQCFVLLFSFVLYKLYRAPKNRDGKGATQHRIWLLYVVLALISIRIVFRMIEYSRGVDSDISRQEFYMYSFDSIPMLVALWLFNVFHPGRSVSGKEHVQEYV